MTKRHPALVTAATSLLLATTVAQMAGCAVGPDYARPEAIPSQDFSPAPLPTETASAPGALGAAQRFAIERDIKADWWTLFGSTDLNALIERAFAANPSIESARAALRIAQENVAAQRGAFFPSVQASYSPSRTQLAGNLGGNSPGIQGDGSVISTGQGTPASAGGTPPFNSPVVYTFHTAQLTVGFVPDVFGGNRRQVEALQAQADSQRLELSAAFVTLTTNIVAATVQDASLRRQVSLTQDMITADEALLALTERQLRAGYSSKLDVAQQRNALAQARALLPPLSKQFELNRDLLRALAGLPQDAEVPAFDLDAFRLPEELPSALPSRIVEQRPDVRIAEEALHAATAQVGIARAARLPQFSIDGTVGGSASHFSEMFWSSGRFFDIALGLTQPIFDGGTLRHRERAADAAVHQAAAQYRLAVLTAFQNIADTLHQIHADAQELTAANEVSDTARTALDLTTRQHDRGYVSRLVLIAAEQSSLQARLGVVQARASRLDDTAALFQALGGGWWHRPEASPAAPDDAAQ